MKEMQKKQKLKGRLLISEHINLFVYRTKEDLDLAVKEFAYVWYNHVRPHTYNQGRTPYAARVA